MKTNFIISFLFMVLITNAQENEYSLANRTFKVKAGTMCEETPEPNPCAGQDIYLVLEFKKDDVSIVEKYISSCNKVEIMNLGNFKWRLLKNNQVQIAATSDEITDSYLENLVLEFSNGQLLGKRKNYNGTSDYTFIEINTLQASLELLQNQSKSKFTLDSTGFSKIENSKFYSKDGDTDVFNINNKNVHLVDFNNDGQKDIIYLENRLHQATVLLVKKDDDFVEIWNGPGELVGLKQGEETIIYVRSNAIGCLPYNMLAALTIKSDNSITESVISHHFDTTIEDLKTTLKELKISGILRTQPIIDDEEKKDPCTGDTIIGNQVKVIENETITVLKEKDNWLLVLHSANGIGMISWIKN